MLTDISYSRCKYPMSDSKVRYGSSSRTNSRPSKFDESINKEIHDLMMKETSKRYVFNPESTLHDKKPKKLGPSLAQSQSHPAVNAKGITILMGVMLAVASVLLFNINIEVEEDHECWEKFKALNCDILNPQGKQCIKLFDCIGEPEYEINMGLIVFGVISLLAGIRFKKNLKELLLNGLQLWEELINNKEEKEEQQ